MSSPEDSLADLLGPDAEVTLDGTGLQIDLATLLAFAVQEPSAPPKRDTPEYRETVAAVAELDQMGRVATALEMLQEDYGWRGPADVMTWWLLQIERAPLTQDPRWRDLTGAVDLRQIVVIDVDEEQRLRIAADRTQKYQAEGLPPHLAFQKGLTETEAGIAMCQRWLPYFRAALTAAHTTPTGAHRAVLAELFKAPGRTDRRELLQAAMVLGTAAYGVRHHYRMAARYNDVAGGREVTHDPSIAPGWDGGGGYLARSALRRR